MAARTSLAFVTFGALLVSSLLEACGSVPLSTMWKMRDFTVQKAFDVDPRRVRAAVLVDPRMIGDEAHPRLRIDVDAPSTRPICYTFALDPVDPEAAGEPMLEAAPAGRRWFAYRLSAPGIDAFMQARRSLHAARLDDAAASLNVTFDTSELIRQIDLSKSIPLSIEIAIDKAGYIALVKDVEVLFKRDANPIKPSTEPCA